MSRPYISNKLQLMSFVGLLNLVVLLLLCASQISANLQDAPKGLALRPLLLPPSQSQSQSNDALVVIAPVGGEVKFSSPEIAKELSRALNNSEAEWEAFKKSGLFIEPYELDLHWIPAAQVEFQRMHTAKDILLYQEILMDAIIKKDNFASGTRLMLKWGPKLISNFLNFRRGEMALPEKRDAKPSFFIMLADLIEEIIELSTKIKREKAYDKHSVDIPEFRSRVVEVFDHYKRIIDTSPLGGYLNWSTARLFKDQPKHARHNIELKQEAADLLAQFRAIGYESTVFFARRLVNMLRLFSKGIIPKSASMI